jgi:hypothetical protein
MRRIILWSALAGLTACTGQFVPDGKDDTGDSGTEGGGSAGDDTASAEDEDGDGWSPADGDCDDANAEVYPGQDEICDDIDNDCDGAVDDSPVDATTWYFDGDGDGHGDPFNTSQSCDPYTNFVEVGDDCDDARSYVNPEAPELCDGLDNDCDGEFDEDVLPEDADTFYIDGDGDGYGTDDATVQACDVPNGYSETNDDCDDTDPTINPGAADATTDGVDNDCDGTADEDAGCNDYRPFGNGASASRTYATTAYDGGSYTETVTISSWTPSTGQAVLQRVMLSSAGSSWTITENHKCNGNAVQMTGYSVTDGGLTSATLTFTAPRTDIEDPASMSPGTQWSFNYSANDALLGSMWDVNGTTEVIGTESVTVAAGTFTALKTETNYTVVDNSALFSGSDRSRTSTLQTWWVNGLGPVKTSDVDGSGRTWESRQLQSYTGFTASR